MAAHQGRQVARRDSAPPSGTRRRQHRILCRSLSSVSSPALRQDDNDDDNKKVDAELPELLAAAANFQLTALRECLDGGASACSVAKNNCNAAHIVLDKYADLETSEQITVAATVIDVISTLAEKGLDLNSRDTLGETPLHIVGAIPGQEAIIEVLVARGARVDRQNLARQTALHKAVLLPDIVNVMTLVKAGADVNVTDMDMKTPLHLVAGSKRSLAVVQFLLRSGAHVNSRDVGLRTPLHIAARAARPEVVEELLESGADVNVVESSGQTALHLAAANDLTGRISRQLLEHSADANLQESVAMETALHRAVVLNMLENIKVLTRSRQVDVNRRDLLGENALHKAYKCRDLVVWEGLLVAGGDVTARSSMGYTPLMKVLKERNTVAAAMMYQYSAMSPD